MKREFLENITPSLNNEWLIVFLIFRLKLVLVAIILTGDDDKVPVKLRKQLAPEDNVCSLQPFFRISAAPFPS